LFIGVQVFDTVSGNVETYNPSSFSLTVENSGVDTLDVGEFDKVKSGSVSATYSLTVDNVVWYFEGSLVENSRNNAGSSTTLENDISSMVTEQNNELDVTLENSGASNKENTDLDITTQDKSAAFNISDDLKDAYGLAPVIIIVLVAAAILGVLTKFRE